MTKRWTIKSLKEPNSKVFHEAAMLLRQGKIVAFPTETVYGLGADATKNSAVQKIFKAKRRPADNPLIAHVSSKEMLESLIFEKPTYVDDLLEKFSPGPLTFVLKSNGTCAENVTAGLDTIAIRIPDHPVALALIDEFNGPIAAPSANLSGKPSPVTADHVWRDLAGEIDGLIDAGPTGIGVESTVIDCTTDRPIILRPGAIIEEELQSVVGEVKKKKKPTRSEKYKHYQPDVPIWLLYLSKEETKELIEKKQQEGLKIGLLGRGKFVKDLPADDSFSLGNSLEEVAQNLYIGLRYFDQQSIDLVFCEGFTAKGIGKTIMNRMEKAATKVIS